MGKELEIKIAPSLFSGQMSAPFPYAAPVVVGRMMLMGTLTFLPISVDVRKEVVTVDATQIEKKAIDNDRSVILFDICCYCLLLLLLLLLVVRDSNILTV